MRKKLLSTLLATAMAVTNACRMWIQWGTAGNHTGNGQ